MCHSHPEISIPGSSMLVCECLPRSSTSSIHLVSLRVKVGKMKRCASSYLDTWRYRSSAETETIQEGAPHSPLSRVESTDGDVSQGNYSPLQSASWRCCAPYGGDRSVLAGRATRAGESTNAPPTSLFFADLPGFVSSHIRLR
jgi:hypothetical protein